jgi:hypothetical protein
LLGLGIRYLFHCDICLSNYLGTPFEDVQAPTPKDLSRFHTTFDLSSPHRPFYANKQYPYSRTRNLQAGFVSTANIVSRPAIKGAPILATTQHSELRPDKVIIQNVPKENQARFLGRVLHRLPILTRVLLTRDCILCGLPHDRPAGLGDPDGFPGCHVLRGVNCVPEGGVGGFDRVGFGLLEEEEGVQADEAELIDDGLVGGVDPRKPGVGVPDEHLVRLGGGKGVADPLDVVHYDFRIDAVVPVVSNAGEAVTEQNLASNGDGDNLIDEGLTVLGDCSGQGGKFAVEDDVAAGALDAEEEGGVGFEGGRDGGDGGVRCTRLDGGVKTGSGEVGGSLETFGGVEGEFIVRFLFRDSAAEGGAVAETFEGS